MLSHGGFLLPSFLLCLVLGSLPQKGVFTHTRTHTHPFTYSFISLSIYILILFNKSKSDIIIFIWMFKSKQIVFQQSRANSILSFLLFPPIISDLANEISFDWLLCLFNMSYYFLNISLLYGITKILQAHPVPVLTLESANFWFLLVENGI